MNIPQSFQHGFPQADRQYAKPVEGSKPARQRITDEPVFISFGNVRQNREIGLFGEHGVQQAVRRDDKAEHAVRLLRDDLFFPEFRERQQALADIQTRRKNA